MGKKFKQFQEEIQDSPYYDYVFNVLHPIEVVPDPNEDDENYDLTRGMSKDNSAIVNEDNNDVRMIYIDEFREYLGEVDDLFNNLAAMGLDSLVTSDTLPSWVGRLRTLRDEILTATPRVDDADYQSAVSEQIEVVDESLIGRVVPGNTVLRITGPKEEAETIKDLARKSLPAKSLLGADVSITSTKNGSNSYIHSVVIKAGYSHVKSAIDTIKTHYKAKGYNTKVIKETANLQELSKGTLASYIKKASIDNVDTREKKRFQPKAISDAYKARREKRLKGIKMAADKLSEEDLQESYRAGELHLNDGTVVNLSEKDASCLNRMAKGTQSKESLDRTLKKNLKEFNALLDFAKSLKEDSQ